METYLNDATKKGVCVDVIKCIVGEHELMNILNTFVELIDKSKVTIEHRILLARALEIHIDFVECRKKLHDEFTDEEGS